MPDIPPDLPLALLHLRQRARFSCTAAVLCLGASRSFRFSAPGPHGSPTPTKQFFGAGSLTSKFNFAGSEHGLRDGSAIPLPATRPRAPAHADSTFFYF